ncbi:hypothetical protein XELAEV_18032577mg [Xenopus laevis]|uniref:PH domain-containing protein n=1 Tax=Xenopus laevis TaxID=8355 RepID=A0A974CHR6_XENLA|nr:hypothetical protein XELAEV_18032577mg [Xenopus laevis]
MRTYKSMELRSMCNSGGLDCRQSSEVFAPAADPSSTQAIQAAIHASKHQKRRPKSLSFLSSELPGHRAELYPGALGGFLDFLKQQSGLRCDSSGGVHVLEPSPWQSPDIAPHHPLSMSVLEIHHVDRGQSGRCWAEHDSSLGGMSSSSGFLRGSSLWSSQRWNMFGRRSQEASRRTFSSLHKSFSFRMRRTADSSKGEEQIENRVRSRREGEDLMKLESPVERSKEDRTGLWRLITAPFRKKEYGTMNQIRTGTNSEPVLIDMIRAESRARRNLQDSFVNSQEWTLSRSVPELKVGIVGNLSSGKSALVHRYLTGTYVQEESPEGGRFKKEIVVDGQSYLLLIRDEGGPPEMQFAAWVDAVVFVFSLEDEISFQTVFNYYARLSSYRNTADVPMVLVGTQDAISATNPRVIDDSRARKLSNDLKRCTYYETCATYGLNVERVFQDVAQKVVAIRKKQQLSIGPCKSLPNSPSHSSVSAASIPSMHMNQATNGGGTFSDYSSSVPSTPSISQRELRIETIAAASTPTPIRKQSKRRSNIFTESDSCYSALLSKDIRSDVFNNSDGKMGTMAFKISAECPIKEGAKSTVDVTQKVKTASRVKAQIEMVGPTHLLISSHLYQSPTVLLISSHLYQSPTLLLNSNKVLWLLGPHPGSASVSIHSPGSASVSIHSPGSPSVSIHSPGSPSVSICSLGSASVSIHSPGTASVSIHSRGLHLYLYTARCLHLYLCTARGLHLYLYTAGVSICIYTQPRVSICIYTQPRVCICIYTQPRVCICIYTQPGSPSVSMHNPVSPSVSMHSPGSASVSIHNRGLHLYLYTAQGLYLYTAQGLHLYLYTAQGLHLYLYTARVLHPYTAGGSICIYTQPVSPSVSIHSPGSPSVSIHSPGSASVSIHSRSSASIHSRVSICIYTQPGVSICIYTQPGVSICIYTQPGVSICIYTQHRVCICIYTQLGSPSVSIHRRGLHLYLYTARFLHLYLCTARGLHLYLYTAGVSICIYTQPRVSIFIYTQQRVYICIYTQPEFCIHTQPGSPSVSIHSRGLHLYLYTARALHLYLYTVRSLHLYLYTARALQLYLYTARALHLYLYTAGVSICIYTQPGLSISIYTQSGLSICIYTQPGLSICIYTQPGLSICIYTQPGLSICIYTQPWVSTCIYSQPRVSICIYTQPGVGLHLYLCTAGNSI